MWMSAYGHTSMGVTSGQVEGSSYFCHRLTEVTNSFHYVVTDQIDQWLPEGYVAIATETQCQEIGGLTAAIWNISL